MQRAASNFWWVGCLALVAALAPRALAQAVSYAQALYGTWYSYPLGNPNTDSVRHEFRHNVRTGNDEMIVTRLCPGDYRAVIARVVVPVEISQNTIKVPKGLSDSEKGELNSVCEISVQAAVMGYSITENGDRISITNPGGSPDSIELARQDAASEAVLPVPLYGTWSFPLQSDRSATVLIQLVFYNSADIDRGMVRQISTCSKGNVTLTSQVQSPVKVTKNQIVILESASHQKEDGPFTCKATITAGTLRFTVSPNGSNLSLSKGNEKPLVLTRDTSAGGN